MRSTEPSPPNSTLFQSFAHCFALTGLGIAQPLYDLFARNPTFFVVHRAPPIAIIGLVAMISIGVPALLIAIPLALRALHPRRGWYVQLGLFGLLAAITAAPLLTRVGSLSAAPFVVIACILGVAFARAYQRVSVVRFLLSVLSLVAVAFPIWFLFFTAIARLVFTQSSELAKTAQITNPVPVVFILFDEFNPTVLLDETRSIDSVRFPNFSALADHSWWFPNANTNFPSTEKAVPSLLTGKLPPASQGVSPSLVDYPQNLFTLLAPHYRLNVVEALTHMSPQETESDTPAAAAAVQTASLASDTAVAFLHIITPRGLRQRLPPVDTQWGGFERESRRDAEAPHSGQVWETEFGFDPKSPRFARFLTRMGAGDSVTLDFLHVLVPHVPYTHLASSPTYYRGSNGLLPEGTTSDTAGWSDQEPLIDVAYLQYIQQVGYVDGLLGSIFDLLRARGAYERSLIIVTGDHGVSFHPNLQRRRLQTENVNDILKVPLFIKLPFQTAPAISERVVDSTDLLPTIADVIDAEIPWAVDGHSMFDPSVPSRSHVEVPGVGTYPASELVPFQRLDWQLTRFGSRTPLHELSQKGPYPALIGRTLAELEAAGMLAEATEMSFESDLLPLFSEVDLESGVLPALFTAHLNGANLSTPISLALLLNDRVWATTTSSKWANKSGYFATLFPAGAFVNGTNRLKVYLVDEAGGSPLLRAIPSRQSASSGRNYRLIHDPGRGYILAKPDGSQIHVESRPDRMEGYIESIETRGNAVQFVGWATDLVHFVPARYILAFKGDFLFSSRAPSAGRVDLVEHFGRASVLNSGFDLTVPRKRLDDTHGVLRFIALDSDDNAYELRMLPAAHDAWIAAQAAIQATRESGIVLLERQSGPRRLQTAEGELIPIISTPKSLNGFVEHVATEAGQLNLSGWAVDRLKYRPALRVYLFHRNQLVGATSPQGNRPDVATAVGNDGVRLSGFLLSIPLDSSTISDLSVVALLEDNNAIEIPFLDSAKTEMDQIQMQFTSP